MIKRKFLVAIGCVALLASACSTTMTSNTAAGSNATKRDSIDAGVDSALSKLYAQVPNSRATVARARGVLVFPSIVSAGFVVGGSYGQGALREGSRVTGYYSAAAGSVGLLAGADSKAVYILFMTQDALNRFKTSNGWTAGADASVTLITVGASANVDTLVIKEPVLGYVLSNGGLMANLSLEGTKFTKLDM